MKNIEASITIDDRKIKKVVRDAKEVIKSMKKDSKRLEKMGFDVNIQIEAGKKIDKVINESITVS